MCKVHYKKKRENKNNNDANYSAILGKLSNRGFDTNHVGFSRKTGTRDMSMQSTQYVCRFVIKARLK